MTIDFSKLIPFIESKLKKQKYLSHQTVMAQLIKSRGKDKPSFLP